MSLALTTFSSCEDFFDPDDNIVLPGDDYMKEASEMYAGFVGITTKLQIIADKSIYLTDSRAEMFEPTGNSTDLYALYNYEPDLTGNTYADPAKYYDVIMACNDYLDKIREYKNNHTASIDESHYKALVGGVLRVKAWTYFMLGKIYGQAVWFDEPMRELVEYPKPIGLDEIIEKCTNLLEVGFDGVDGKSKMSWTEWIIATDELGAEAAQAYAEWDLMSIEYFALAAELELWKRNPNYYRIAYELILPKMNEAFATALNTNYRKWMLGIGYGNGLSGVFNGSSTIRPAVAVSMISFNYEKNQMNTLYDLFYGNDRMLIPTDSAVARYRNPEFNPAPEGQDFTLSYDKRESTFIGTDSKGKYIFKKYTKSTKDNPIYIYRSSDLYFMLIEAFNHLEQYDQMNALLHNGVSAVFPMGGVTWIGFTDFWTQYTPRGTASTQDTGIRGVLGTSFGKTRRTLLTYDGSQDKELSKKNNDLEILREIILEQAGEGKTYQAMLRMARRYNDYNIIADLVCPKYPEAKQAEIRSKIVNGSYFVPWNIDSKSSTH